MVQQGDVYLDGDKVCLEGDPGVRTVVNRGPGQRIVTPGAAAGIRPGAPSPFSRPTTPDSEPPPDGEGTLRR